jgi:hypothetical protein
MRPLRRQSRTEEVYVPPEKRNTYLAEDEVVSAKTFSIEEVINRQELANDLEKADSLKKTDAKLEKVETRTGQLIEKSKKRELRSLQIKNKSPQVTTHQEQILLSAKTKKEASLIEFHCLRGLPKSIIIHIQERANLDSQLQKWISVIDTEELKLITKKTASHLSVQLLRLEKQGWFQILKSNNAGVRVIEIDPSIYPTKQ